MRRSSPNWVAAALAGLWLILFLAAPLFRISPFGLSVPFISQGVGGASAIGAAPAVLLMLIPGILMLLSSLLWEKNVGLILSGATFVILLIFLLACGSSVCRAGIDRGILSVAFREEMGSAASYVFQVRWGWGGILCLLLTAGVFVAELLLGDRSRSTYVPNNNDFEF